ncbi:MAG: elongation factor G [Isosphaeraceae bacterium]
MASDPDQMDLRQIRNIGIIAHIDAGKTTTTERILYYTGEIHRMGDVDKGNTTTDYLEEERERGITIVAAAITCRWKDAHGQPITINIIDTPGHVDFTAEVERSLRVLDGAVVIFSAVEGVEAQSETVWRQAAKYHVPRLCFINKMDRIGAEFERVYKEIEERLLESHPIPIQVPIGAGPEGTMGEFQGLIDLVAMKALHFQTEDLGSTFTVDEIPDELRLDAEAWRETMLNSLSAFDETFAEEYMAHLDGAELSEAMIHAALRRATLTGRAQPVLCGSSFKYVGVQQLLDAVAAHLPSPLDRPPIVGHHPKKGTELARKPSPAEPFSSLVFKITNDAHGDLSFVRIYSGSLKAGTRVYNPGKDKKENSSRLYHIRADDREQINVAGTGDIVGIVGLKDSVTGDTLCDAAHPILLERIEFPETVISMSIEPVSSADKGKLADTLNALAREDPTFTFKVNEETGQTLISGMGELHLEILKNRMTRDYNLKVHVGRPRVSYRETIKKAVRRVEGACIRQTGGSGLYARITIDLEPEAQPKGAPVLHFVNKLKGGAIPSEFIPAIEAGLREEAKSGGRTGYPLVDLKVTLTDGAYHDVDSSDLAYRFAASDALRKAVEEAGPVLLEPIMRIEVVTPEDYLGNVTGDLSSRRALIDRTSTRGKLIVIDARAPLEKMFGYSTAVRSLSQGRAGYTMEPLEYAPAPESMLEALT